MASLVQLQTWLAAAETARHALLMGERTASFSITTGGGTRSFTYTQATKADLDSYIENLENQIVTAQGTTRKRTFRLYQSGRGF